jgi:antitoxin component of RelBE/YafQ-DinJ toxin-antitoxin module
MSSTENDVHRRVSISTRIDSEVAELIARAAEERRTTPSQVARVLLEDAARLLQSEQREHAA